MSAPTTYVARLNALIRARVERTPRLVCFGQNLTAGSSLSGLTAGLKPGPESRVLNTQNSEYTLVGVGFGLMLRGVSSIYIMKQQDFLLFGMDHLVNTWNTLRTEKLPASYTVVSIVVDSGYEGPQSRLNNFGEFCSMARVQGYAITNHDDAGAVIDRHLVAPGFRLIGVSQRLFREPCAPGDPVPEIAQDGGILCYGRGKDATIVSFNFSYPQAVDLRRALAGESMSASLFSVNAMLVDRWDEILADVKRTGRLVIVDDSRSSHRLSHQLDLAVRRSGATGCIVVRERDATAPNFAPNDDRFVVDAASVLSELRGSR